MVEVFKTNVENEDEAKRIVNAVHCKYRHNIANFDLEDCDRILRVESKNGKLKISELLYFLKELGLEAEILPDCSKQ